MTMLTMTLEFFLVIIYWTSHLDLWCLGLRKEIKFSSNRSMMLIKRRARVYKEEQNNLTSRIWLLSYSMMYIIRATLIKCWHESQTTKSCRVEVRKNDRLIGILRVHTTLIRIHKGPYIPTICRTWMNLSRSTTRWKTITILQDRGKD